MCIRDRGYGAHPLDAIRYASYNAAREYGFDDLGAFAPGYVADMQLVDALDGRRPSHVSVSYTHLGYRRKGGERPEPGNQYDGRGT